MDTVGKAVQVLIGRLLIVKGQCPECDRPLYSWRQKNMDGTERCAPTCMNCGFTDLRRKADFETAQIYDNSLKSRAINFFKSNSLVPDTSLYSCKLLTYKAIDQETETAIDTAQKAVRAVLDDEPAHILLSGKSGVGKSHLAMGMCWEVIEQSNYDKKCIFINYRELLEQIKFSFNDDELRKVIQGSLMADLKTTDLVVIDDVGAELGGSTYSNSSNFNNDTLNSILEARQNRATIITTNLTGKELSKAYGERIVSRMFKSSEGYTVRFEKTADKRLKAI